MKKFFIVLSVMLAGCVSTPIINQANLQEVDFEALLQQKVSRSCNTMLFGILPLGPQASVAAAAWGAGIKHVSYVETSIANLLPLFVQQCVIVYGE